MDEKKVLIIDAHNHIALKIYEGETKGTIENAISVLDTCGVERSVIAGAGLPHQLDQNNRLCAAAVKKYPERLIGFVGVNPHLKEKTLEVIDQAVNEWGFRGIKLHPWLEGFPANDRIVYPIMERAEKYDIPVLFHSGTPPFSTPLLIADIAMHFPKVKVIMGHMGKNMLYCDAICAAKLSKNIFLETSAAHILPVVHRAVEEIGAERVLYGSDHMEVSVMRYRILQIMDLDISREEKALILGKNIARILRIQV